MRVEARPTRTGGLHRSENPGTSSDKGSENLPRRKPKVSDGRFVRVGLAGPKPRPKGVGDGQPVDIPAPLACGNASGATPREPACRWCRVDLGGGLLL